MVSLLLVWLLLSNVSGPTGSPLDPTMGSESMFNKRLDRSLVSKAFMERCSTDRFRCVENLYGKVLKN